MHIKRRIHLAILSLAIRDCTIFLHVENPDVLTLNIGSPNKKQCQEQNPSKTHFCFLFFSLWSRTKISVKYYW